MFCRYFLEGFDELFSLEDEDISQMFITQESKNHNSGFLDKSGEEEDGESGLFMGVKPTDFKSPCTTVTYNQNSQKYSDISDDDDLILPPKKKMKSG